MIDVITRFVTLAAICNFDNMYANSLHENKMKGVAGKILKKYFFRNHKFLQGKWRDQQEKLRVEISYEPYF